MYIPKILTLKEYKGSFLSPLNQHPLQPRWLPNILSPLLDKATTDHITSPSSIDWE